MKVQKLKKHPKHPIVGWRILYRTEGNYDPDTEKMAIGILPHETLWGYSPTIDAIVFYYNMVILHEMVEWGTDPEYRHTQKVGHIWDMIIGRILHELVS